MSFKSLEEIKAWQASRQLANRAFELYSREPFSKDYGLKDQLNRSTGSIMDNIAEGYGRMGNREFINFLSYAKGSCLEAKSQLIRAYDRNYITEAELDELEEMVNKVDNLIGGFMSYLKKSDFKGQKFKEEQAPYNIKL